MAANANPSYRGILIPHNPQNQIYLGKALEDADSEVFITREFDAWMDSICKAALVAVPLYLVFQIVRAVWLR